MKTVHEVSSISGVSIRTLHHYDAIGLLKPTKITEAGYRLYDESAMVRLQTILIYRELGFALADIRQILDSPEFDLRTALSQHIEMLRMQRSHIDSLITQAERMIEGENADFRAFDNSKMTEYAKEVKERWGSTASCKESQSKAESRSDEENKNIADGLMSMFSEFGALRNNKPDSEEAQNAVSNLQEYITQNYYACDKTILACLGQMYIGDERFRENIDKAGGEGTAKFASEAIEFFCK